MAECRPGSRPVERFQEDRTVTDASDATFGYWRNRPEKDKGIRRFPGCMDGKEIQQIAGS